ncbi:MAG: hypothetical protein U0946_07610, partial [Patescibacteria group bacterium]|nr:hypothetical protein [Patescibacteria group bacterium]
PGGVGSGSATVSAGYGPGGGFGSSNQNIDCVNPPPPDDIAGGGGGYGGKGGKGYYDFSYSTYGLEGGPIYGDSVNPQNASDTVDRYGNLVPAIFGSGGAGGIHEHCPLFDHDHNYYTGGSGGGSVIIYAQSVIIRYDTVGLNQAGIWANGTDGVDAENSGGSGGGSGGLIYIKTDYFNSSYLGMPNAFGKHGGEDGTVWVKDPAQINFYGGNSITAKGGQGNNLYRQDFPYGSGGGGGGRVVIDAPLTLDGGSLEPTSQMIKVEVKWSEGAREEKVELKTLLKDVR